MASLDWGAGLRRLVTGSVNPTGERVLSKPPRSVWQKGTADLEMD